MSGQAAYMTKALDIFKGGDSPIIRVPAYFSWLSSLDEIDQCHAFATLVVVMQSLEKNPHNQRIYSAILDDERYAQMEATVLFMPFVLGGSGYAMDEVVGDFLVMQEEVLKKFNVIPQRVVRDNLYVNFSSKIDVPLLSRSMAKIRNKGLKLRFFRACGECLIKNEAKLTMFYSMNLKYIEEEYLNNSTCSVQAAAVMLAAVLTHVVEDDARPRVLAASGLWRPIGRFMAERLGFWQYMNPTLHDGEEPIAKDVTTAHIAMFTSAQTILTLDWDTIIAASPSPPRKAGDQELLAKYKREIALKVLSVHV